MADVNSILDGEAISLRRAVIGTYYGNGEWGNVNRVYGTTDIAFSALTTGAERWGDGSRRLAGYRVKTGSQISITFANSDLTTVATVLGLTPEVTGVAPERERAMRIDDRGIPYVGINAAFDLNTATEMAYHVFVPKMMPTSDTIDILSVTGGETPDFGTTTLEFIGYYDEYYEFGGVNTIQTVALGSPSVGTFNLGLGSQYTTDLAFDVTASAMQDALEELTNIREDNITVTLDTGVYTLTFVDERGNSPINLLRSRTSDTFDGTVTITRVQQGRTASTHCGGAYEIEAGTVPDLPPTFTV